VACQAHRAFPPCSGASKGAAFRACNPRAAVVHADRAHRLCGGRHLAWEVHCTACLQGVPPPDLTLVAEDSGYLVGRHGAVLSPRRRRAGCGVAPYRPNGPASSHQTETRGMPSEAPRLPGVASHQSLRMGIWRSQQSHCRVTKTVGSFPCQMALRCRAHGRPWLLARTHGRLLPGLPYQRHCACGRTCRPPTCRWV